jgi:hypothetical protein
MWWADPSIDTPPNYECWTKQLYLYDGSIIINVQMTLDKGDKVNQCQSWNTY